MKRVSVTIPDELAREVRHKLPGVNVSGLLQDALRAALECPHGRLVCATCSMPVDGRRVAQGLLDAFYRDVLDALERLLIDGGSVEGAARVTRTVGLRHQIPLASIRPLPCLTRAERAERTAAAKERHPSAHLPEEHHEHRTVELDRSAVA